MSIKILLFAISATAITSCNTAYKSGQTPDDVYYSPLRVVEENSNKEEQKPDHQNNVARNEDNAEDREIRMKTHDRRWRDINDGYDCNCSCDHTPYKYGYNKRYYYNPYYYPYPVYLDSRSITPKNSTARMVGLGGYNTFITAPVVNPKTGKTEYVPAARTYNNNNQQTREPLPHSNNNRTYSPSSNSTGANNSGSGNNVPRPRRN
ncbi:MAG: hypothetical protein ABIP80_05295 [Ferruginibacter sp.]